MKFSTLSPLVHRSGRKLVVGVRREDPKRIWERRAPLTPDDVHHLVSNFNLEVHVVPCSRRVFPIEEYEKAGARIMASLDNSHIVLGIKEVPLQELDLPLSKMRQAFAEHRITPAQMAASLANTPTHLMFSHTIKGQSYNTPLLSRFVSHEDTKPHLKGLYPRLIDYELLTDSKGKRTVGFGWFAGVAGVLESLSAMAHSHLEIGVASPFLYTPRPHTLPSLDRLRTELRNIGAIISNQGTPAKLGPFIIGLTGTGNVAQGCLSMLSELPIQSVQVAELDNLVRDANTDLRKIYLVHAKPEDYFIGLDGRKYDRDHYYSSPQSYMSVFNDKIAPYLTLFLNGTGWSPAFPRLMTNDQLTGTLERARLLGGARFTNIGDISCDVEGGLQFLTNATTLSEPFYKTRPPSLPTEYPSVQMMAVDILPASIPLDASQHFSKALLPYLESLIRYHTSSTTDEHTEALARATVASKGALNNKHSWLQPAVNDFYTRGKQSGGQESQNSKKKMHHSQSVATDSRKDGQVENMTLQPARRKRILMLGSGMVAKPAVDMIAKHPGVDLVIASNSLLELQALSKRHLNVRYRIIDVFNESTYAHLVDEADVVISLLPIQYHPSVAQLCIDSRKHMVTASYISKAMADLHSSAVDADVLLLNEIGLDPGIDHCSAVELISRLKSQHKTIVSFSSFCGGLPAPEDSYVPLRYKFSWRPHGVLAATLNSAAFKLRDVYEKVDGEHLLRAYFPEVPITKDFLLEGLPNRDSLQYASAYKLQLFNLRTLLRGTLRYPGFAKLMSSFKHLGLLEQLPPIRLENWTDFVKHTLAIRYADKDGIVPSLQHVIPIDDIPPLMEALEWLGLLAPPTLVATPYRNQMPALPAEPMVPLDIFAYLLASKLAYAPHERDMVVLSHEIIARDQVSNPIQPNFNGIETIYTSTLITYGNTEDTAMSRTVGIPVAIAALNIVEDKIDLRGVAGPMDRSVYLPVLQGLAEEGLGMKETVRTVFVDGAALKHQQGSVEQALVDSRLAVSIPDVERYSETPEEGMDLETEWKL